MSTSRDLKIGAFVLMGLLFAAAVIFLIGDERRLFASSVGFTTRFQDVGGLKAGAPVRMGGIDIGNVESVGYDAKAGSDTTVYVSLRIVSSEASRIKSDSKALISTKGLLGDKMIELTVGKSADSMPAGSEIPSDPGIDVMGKVTGMADKADLLIESLTRVSEPLGNEELHADIRGSVASIRTILHEVAEGQGYPHKLLTDPAESERISRMVDNLERTSNELQMTLRKTREVIARVESGPGFAHDVVYGEGPKGLAEFSDAASEVALTLRGVRESDSLAHDIVYGGKGDGAEALTNVTAITADVRAIVSDMRAGKGTIGALLVDPSVYEDVKVVLGNVQRNDVLRALVRYSIHRDEARPSVEVSAPSARSEGTSSGVLGAPASPGVAPAP
jgi:phospholipid/cholesterol/gamma-HCH transport system substrate-binding protein